MPETAASQNGDLSKEKFDDVLRRLDHHAHIVRVATTDFFKTMFLVQGGGLVTLCITIMNHLTSAATPGGINKFPEPLVMPIRGIAINLTVGMSLSFLGYLFSCNRAHRKTVEYRQVLNEYLYEGLPIVVEKANINAESKRAFALFFVLALIFISIGYDTISMIVIIERIMSLP